MKFDPLWLPILSELFVNLSAGWFGAALVIPATTKLPKEINFGLLTINIGLGIFFLVLAFEFRRLVGL